MSLLSRKESAPAAQIPASFHLGVLVDQRYAQWKDQFFGATSGKVVGIAYYDSAFTMVAFGILDNYAREVIGEQHVDEKYVEIVFKCGRRYLPMSNEKIASLEKMRHKSIVYVDRRLFLGALGGIRGKMMQDGTRDEYALRDFDEFVLNAEHGGGLPKGARFLYDDRPKPSLFSL